MITCHAWHDVPPDIAFSIGVAGAHAAALDDLVLGERVDSVDGDPSRLADLERLELVGADAVADGAASDVQGLRELRGGR